MFKGAMYYLVTKALKQSGDENEHRNLSYVVLGQHLGMHLSCKLRDSYL
jgi:hypothetical protein